VLSILALIVVLGVLVFVHEAGHFLAAKWAGIYVHRFALGLGAPIKALSFRRGETEYAICWLPLGGYVKMASREEAGGADALEGGAVDLADVPPERVFEAKPVWKRIVVILAGVTMNALFAYLVFAGLAWSNGRSYQPTTTVGYVDSTALPRGAEALRELRPGDRIVRVGAQPVANWDEVITALQDAPETATPVVLASGDSVVMRIHHDALEERFQLRLALAPYQAAVVDTVLPESPAARGGLARGDTLLAADGRPLAQWYDLVAVLNERRDAPVTLLVGRDGGRRELRLTPRLDSVPTPDGGYQRVGRIGVGPRIEVAREPYTLGGALAAGGRATADAAWGIVRAIRGMVGGRISSRQIGGPILIGQMAGQSARLGLEPFLAFMALISVNLAVLNMLPIPVLDGGQFLFLLAEAVIRRPLPLKLRERLTAVGLVLILMLMVFAFWNDFRRLFEQWGLI
jgi:regulator of sigma E protease